MSLEEVGLSFSKWVNEALVEIEEGAEELKAFFLGFQEEVKNGIHKPTFVVPKTPIAKRLRKIKSKKYENGVQQSDTETRTTRSTRSTRSKRNTQSTISNRSTRNTHARNNLEVNNESPNEQNKQHRSTYKSADKKIGEEENDTTNDPVRVSEGRKRTREEDNDVQEAPRKTRRVGKKQATSKSSDCSSKCDSPGSVLSETNVSTQSAVSDVKCPPIQEESSEQEVKLGVENIAKGSINNEYTDSAIGSQATSDPDNTNNSCASVKSNNRKADSAQSADLFQNMENEVESSVLEEPPVGNASTPNEPSKNLKEQKICNTTVTIVTPTVENPNDVIKSMVNTSTNSTFVSSVQVKLKQHVTPTEAIKQEDASSPAFSPFVKLQRLSPDDCKILNDITGKTNSSSNVKKATTNVQADVRPKTVFSAYTSSPVKDRVAAFEKLKNEREKLVQKAASAVKAAEVNAEPVRMTRTKARALAAAAAQNKEQQVGGEKNVPTSDNRAAEKIAARLAARKSLYRAKKISVVKERRELEVSQDSEWGKENSMNSFSTSMLSSKGKSFMSTSKKYKTTPLLSNSSNLSHSGNRNPGILGSSVKKHYNVVNGFITGVESLIIKPVKVVVDDFDRKKEEMRRRMEKEEEAKKKKEELLRARTEENKRKREEKMQKAQQAREIREREKLEMQARLEKEKEEKYKLMLQEREKTKEQLQLKKQQAQQKAIEMEERRKLEEAARKAKMMEQEEEQQRLQAARKKEQEEHQKHLAEGREAAVLREQQAKAQVKVAKEKELKGKEAKEKAKEKMKAPAAAKPPVLDKTFDVSQTQKVTPVPNGSVNENDYGIDEDVGSSDDENETPTRPIPIWARRDVRKIQLEAQIYLPEMLIGRAFSSKKTTPNILEMFDHLHSITRTSSAVWRTPPRASTLPSP